MKSILVLILLANLHANKVGECRTTCIDRYQKCWVRCAGHFGEQNKQCRTTCEQHEAMCFDRCGEQR